MEGGAGGARIVFKPPEPYLTKGKKRGEDVGKGNTRGGAEGVETPLTANAYKGPRGGMPEGVPFSYALIRKKDHSQ